MEKLETLIILVMSGLIIAGLARTVMTTARIAELEQDDTEEET